MKALQRASEHFQAGDALSFYETLAVSAFRSSHISVTLANPSLPDCPLVGVSRGFEEMTGYRRSEIIGRNCRFLNTGCPMSAEVRSELRDATRNQRRFVRIILNRRRNGEAFNNLLHMSPLRVGSALYIVGVQADVTHTDADLEKEDHMAELNQIVDAIFAANIDAWVSLQISNLAPSNWSLTAPVPYAEFQLQQSYSPDVYAEAKKAFVALQLLDVRDTERICYVNTFLQVESRDESGSAASGLRRSSSEPMFSASSGNSLRLPAEMLRDCLRQLQKGFSGVEVQATKPTKDVWEVQLEDLASQGSSLHPNGCTPCSFHCYSFMGCNKGESCNFCHMDHPKRTRRRGKKQKGHCKEDGGDLDLQDKDTDLQVEAASSLAPTKETEAIWFPLLSALEHFRPLPDVDMALLFQTQAIDAEAPTHTEHASRQPEIIGKKPLLRFDSAGLSDSEKCPTQQLESGHKAQEDSLWNTSSRRVEDADDWDWNDRITCSRRPRAGVARGRRRVKASDASLNATSTEKVLSTEGDDVSTSATRPSSTPSTPSAPSAEEASYPSQRLLDSQSVLQGKQCSQLSLPKSRRLQQTELKANSAFG